MRPLLGAIGFLLTALPALADPGVQPKLALFDDPTGQFATYQPKGPASEPDNPFFQVLGANGRACVTCHQAADGWSISAAHVRDRYRQSQGADPLFRPVDGATCPSDDISTPAAARKAYALLLDKGLIRVSLPVPNDAEFKVVSIEDPYHCSTPRVLSVYRRPLPSTNLRFLTTIMWDGRFATLKAQASDAAHGHLQASRDPNPEQLGRILDFESGLYTAQVSDQKAGSLSAAGAKGGPLLLPALKFFAGVNDPFGLNPTGAVTNENVFFLYLSWDNLDGSSHKRARASIARGQAIFNNRPMTMFGVGGLNDVRGNSAMTVTCGTCHDTPEVGNHSINDPGTALFNIGVSDSAQRTPDLPLFTLKCKDGSTHVTSDPGRALITGKCADIDKFRVPSLRALAAHPPYFHNGTAATLLDVVTFYDTRFLISLSAQEKADLAAFLGAL